MISNIAFGGIIALYFLFHSVLAMVAIKRYFPQQRYRLFYSLTAILGLVLILYHLWYSAHEMIFVAPLAQKLIGSLITITGLWIIYKSTKNYSTKAFLGLEAEQCDQLAINGLNQYVRHPMYNGNFHLFLGLWLAIPSVRISIFCALSLFYLFIGTYLEERKLRADYGAAYREYQTQVPMFFPYGNIGAFYRKLVSNFS